MSFCLQSLLSSLASRWRLKMFMGSVNNNHTLTYIASFTKESESLPLPTRTVSYGLFLPPLFIILLLYFFLSLIHLFLLFFFYLLFLSCKHRITDWYWTGSFQYAWEYLNAHASTRIFAYIVQFPCRNRNSLSGRILTQATHNLSSEPLEYRYEGTGNV